MIVILTPYTHNEVTYAAIRLANLILAGGGEVRLVSPTGIENGVHGYWDRHVRSGRGSGIYFASSHAQTFVHFQPNAALKEMTELVSPEAQHVLVPQWHQLREHDSNVVATYDDIVCASKTCKENIQNIVFQVAKSDSLLAWTPWTAGIPTVSRDGLVREGGCASVLFMVNHTTCSDILLQTISALLQELRGLTVSLVYTRSWRGEHRKLLRQLLSSYADRFRSVKLQGHDMLNKELHAHDWTVLTWTKADFGITAARSLACGSPVIAYDVPPFNELICNGRNGFLIPCESKSTTYQAQTAIPTVDATLATLIPAFRDNKMLFTMQSQDWNLRGMESAFNSFWARLLGLTPTE